MERRNEKEGRMIKRGAHDVEKDGKRGKMRKRGAQDEGEMRREGE